MKTTITFLLYKAKTNSKGLCPIRCRLTYQKKRKEFSTGIFINPSNWNSKQQLVEPPEPDEQYINTQLSLIRQKLNQAFLFLQVKGSPFDVMDIYTQYLGETPKDEMGVMEIYRLYCDRIKKLVGIDIKEVTYKKYLESGRHLSAFIRWKYKRKDIQLKSLKEAFLDDYSYFLRTERNMAQSTLNKAIQRFRKVIKYAIAQDYLSKDPFMLYKPKTVKKEVVFLSREELQTLEEMTFKLERLERIRDMLVFCCYTGLGFKEMANLKKEDISIEFDGKPWIHVKRQKTGRAYKIPILKKAQEIMDKYEEETDYTRELNQSAQMAEDCRHIPNLRFPSYYPELSCDRILTMDWMYGQHLSQWCQKPFTPEQGQKIGQTLWDFYMYQMHVLRRIHADPHPGNFLIDDQDNLMVIDFGCLKEIPEDFYEPYFELAQKENLQNPEYFERQLYALEILKPEDSPREKEFFYSIFHEMLSLFTRPFHSETFDFSNQEFFDEIGALGQKYANDSALKEMNGNRGSKHFIYINRTFFGLYNLMFDLKAKDVEINNFKKYTQGAPAQQAVLV